MVVVFEYVGVVVGEYFLVDCCGDGVGDILL